MRLRTIIHYWIMARFRIGKWFLESAVGHNNSVNRVFDNRLNLFDL